MKKYEDWAEKYRPKALKYIVGNDDIISDLQRFVLNMNFPNILAIGSAGIGKTTAMRLLAKQIGVPVLEINASIDNRIQVIREDVTDYAYQMDIEGSPFKIIILDQVERLTKDAQQASLQLTEEVSSYCKFLATSNDVRSLHEAFLDRFKVYRFEPISPPDIVKRLKRICRKENIRADSSSGDISEILYDIARASRGSVRMAIKTLQAAAEGKERIDKADVKAWTWVPPYAKIRKSISLAVEGKFSESINIANEILKNTQPKWFFMGINDELLKRKKYTDEERIAICMYLPEGNPHGLVDNDVYKFLALIAREFE